MTWTHLYTRLQNRPCSTNISLNLPMQVCLVSDPRPANPTGRTYTVDCLGNIVGGRPTVYHNQTIDDLFAATRAWEPAPMRAVPLMLGIGWPYPGKVSPVFLVTV